MDDTARALARRWVDGAGEGGTIEPPLHPDVPASDLAVALKDEAMAAWGTVPRRAVQCAALLERLRTGEAVPLVHAMADWSAGLAALAEGRLADAGERFDAADTALLGLGRRNDAAQTRVPRMVVFSMLGQHDAAQACGEAALAAFVEAGDERSAGKVELNLGTLLSRRDRHAEAVALYRRATVRAARAGDRELSIRADISLANGLTWLADFDEAARVLERALMRSSTHGHAVLAAQARGALGRIALVRGDYARTLRELAAAHEGLAAAGASPQQLLDAELSLADAYQAVELLPEAHALYDQAVRDAQALGASTELATALLERARVAQRLGRTADALADLGAARAAFAEEGNEASVAWADLCRAAAQMAAGDTRAALQSACGAGERLAGLGLRGWALEAAALQAAAAAASGDHETARSLYESTLADAQALAPVRWTCHGGLAALARDAHDTASARAHAQAALSALDDTRAALPGDSFRSAFGADAQSLNELLVQLDRSEGVAPAVLLETLERGRARALDAALAGGMPPAGAPASAQAALRWVRERRREALADGDSTALQRLATEEAACEHDLLEALRRAQIAQPAVADGDAPGAVIRISDMLQALTPHQAVVMFHAAGERWLACVARAEGVRVFELDAGEVVARLRGLQLQLDALRLHGTQRLRGPHGALLMARVRIHLQALHATLWAPFADTLAGVRRIVVVPHGLLHYLPFAALHDGRQWLVERHDISLAPSATWAVQAMSAVPAAPQRVLALGYGAQGLAHVEQEASRVAAAFSERRVLLGAAATQAALREQAQDADVVHLACHAQFRADNPMFSSLELADGPLALHEMPSLRLRAQLVALSACETGVSRLAPGNEAIGLVRGFLLAGVRSVLASGWAVDDEATALLMHAFYRRLCAGEGAATALAGAQCEQAGAGAHPFHWAAFALHGRG